MSTLNDSIRGLVPRATKPTVLLAIAIVLAACGGAAGLAGPAVAPAAGPGDQSTNGSSRNGSNPLQGGSGGNPTGNNTSVLYDINTANLQIIKTGSLALQVSGLEAAVDAAGQRITALGGYASGSQRSGEDDRQVATVTYRIPAAKWDEALAALKALGTKVLTEQTETQDVTAQVVDLGARITNLQATEQALQAIMTKATEIKDVLAVQAELTTVRGQIEQLTAERKHLQEQAAFSTLTVSYSLKEDAVLLTSKQFDPDSEIDRASASLVDVLQGLAKAGIWFAIVWLPILIGLAIVTLIGATVFRRFVRRPGGTPGTDGGSMPPAPAEG